MHLEDAADTSQQFRVENDFNFAVCGGLEMFDGLNLEHWDGNGNDDGVSNANCDEDEGISPETARP